MRTVIVSTIFLWIFVVHGVHIVNGDVINALTCSDSTQCTKNSTCCRSRCRSTCLNARCLNTTDCGYEQNLLCCAGKCRKNCSGATCFTDKHCGGEYSLCCGVQCRSNCSNSWCRFDEQCAGDYRYCCNGACQLEVCQGNPPCDSENDCSAPYTTCCNGKCSLVCPNPRSAASSLQRLWLNFVNILLLGVHIFATNRLS